MQRNILKIPILRSKRSHFSLAIQTNILLYEHSIVWLAKLRGNTKDKLTFEDIKVKKSSFGVIEIICVCIIIMLGESI